MTFTTPGHFNFKKMKEKSEEEKKEDVLNELENLIKEMEGLQRKYEVMKDKLPEAEKARLKGFFEDTNAEEDGNS